MTLFAAGFVAGLIAGTALGALWADRSARYGEHSGRVDRLIRRAKRGDRLPRGLDSDLERTQEIFPAVEGTAGGRGASRTLRPGLAWRRDNVE